MDSSQNTNLGSGSYALSHEIIYHRVGDELIIINLKTDMIFSLNTSGARFFELLASQMNMNEIKQTLREQFYVEPDELEREIIKILESLLQEGMIYAV